MTLLDTPTPATGFDPVEALYHLWADGPHSLCIDPGGAFTYVRHYTDPAELFATAQATDGHAWWGVNPTPNAESRGSSDDVTEAGVLFCDLDWADDGSHKSSELPSEGKVRAVVDAFPIVPTVIVETGGGIHVYWKLNNAVDRDTWEHGQELVRAALEAEGLHVEATDAPRILRVPGTLNHKTDPPRPVTVSHFKPRAPGKGITVELFEKRYSQLIAATEKTRQAEVESIWSKLNRAAKGPISDYNAEHSIEAELTASGWDPNGSMWWSRPDRPNGLGQSAKIHIRDDGSEILMVYTSAPELADLFAIARPTRINSFHWCTAFDLYALREHNGDMTEATDAVKSWPKTPPPNVDPETGEITQPAVINLPPAFWEARPWLTHIRDAAWSRLMSPDAVLGAFLARYATLVPNCYWIPAIIGSTATFDHLSVVVGQSSGGKSAAAAIARELLPPRFEKSTVWDFPCPSGEGLLEAFFEMVSVEDDNGKKPRREKKRTKSAVHFIVDEAMALIAQTERSGTTISSVLCSAWAGQTLGQGNAAEENKRVIPAGEARVSGLMGIQMSLGHKLMSDDLVAQGLTGRLMFFAAEDPSMPEPIQPDWPGELTVEILPVITSFEKCKAQDLVVYAPEIHKEIREARIAVVKGRRVERAVDGHQRLAQLKVAGMFAFIEGRTDVTVEDWELASFIIASSAALRDVMDASGRDARRRDNQSRGIATGERDAAADDVKRRRRDAEIVKRAEWIRDKVKEGPANRQDLYRKAGRWRSDFEEALAHAEAEEWIGIWEEDSGGNGSKRRMIGFQGVNT